MKALTFHPEALVELRESVRYYESQRSGLGRHFLEAIRSAVHHIQSFPQMYPVVDDGIRCCSVLRFPYGVIYRIRAEHLEVIAVMHLRREPGYWRSRT